MNTLSKQGRDAVIEWLLESDEPWTRYRTWIDLLNYPESDPRVLEARSEMLADPRVNQLAADLSVWGDRPLKRHNDASHPIYKLSTLTDFGLRAGDTLPGIDLPVAGIIEQVMAHQACEGAFQTVLNIPQRFGGTGEDDWAWMVCDAPTLLYSLLALSSGDDHRLDRAVEHLAGLPFENGWRCAAAPELGRFRGPGRKDDPCPIANVYALKALAQVPAQIDGPAVRSGAETLLRHWEQQNERRFYLFGIGTDFRRLKYPCVWYDILHVVDTLSQFAFVHGDARFVEMVRAIIQQADGAGRYTASSMYRAWKGWSFSDKQNPSPWLTLLVLRILKRMEWNV